MFSLHNAVLFTNKICLDWSDTAQVYLLYVEINETKQWIGYVRVEHVAAMMEW